MQKSILTWFFFINKKKSKKSLLTCNYVNCLLWMIWSSYETLQWSWTYLPKNTLRESHSYLPFLVLIGFLLIFTPVFCYFPINHRPPLKSANHVRLGFKQRNSEFLRWRSHFFPLWIMLIWYSSFSACALFIFYIFWTDYTFQYFDWI